MESGARPGLVVYGLLQALPHPALLLHADRIVSAVNGAFERLSGLPEDRLVGHLPEFIRVGAPGGGSLSLADQLQAAGSFSGEGQLQGGDGRALPIRLAVTPLSPVGDARSGYLLQVVPPTAPAGAQSMGSSSSVRQTFAGLIEAASRRLTPGEFFDDMQPYLAGLFGPVWSALYRLDGGVLRLAACEGIPESVRESWETLPLQDFAFLRRPHHWQRGKSTPAPQPPFDKIKCGSMLAAPLTQNEALLGCIILFHPNPDGLGKPARNLLESLAAPLSANFARAQLFEQVRQSQREWAVTFDALPDFILILDGEGRVTQLNAAAAEQFGKPAAECGGLRVDELPQAPLLPAEHLLAICWVGGPELQEWQLPGGAVMQVRHSRIDPEGRPPERRLVTLRDVTALSRLEADLMHQRQMAEVGQLVAGVAHEVRNPLFSITATLDNLRRALSTDSAVQRFLPTLEKQTSRLTKLMEELLDYSRPVSNALLPGDLQTVLNDAVGQCRRIALDAGVELNLKVNSRLPPVAFDRGRLVEALLNLLENALQHTPAGGRVLCEALVVEQGVRVTVRDSGPGVPAELQARIFEPFFTSREGGTGLGLPIVQRIIEAHGGSITLRPPGSGGACFDILLPRHLAE
jgi:signal transduction histidine kinase